MTEQKLEVWAGGLTSFNTCLLCLPSGAASSGDIDVLVTHPSFDSSDTDFDKVGHMSHLLKHKQSQCAVILEDVL